MEPQLHQFIGVGSVDADPGFTVVDELERMGHFSCGIMRNRNRAFPFRFPTGLHAAGVWNMDGNQIPSEFDIGEKAFVSFFDDRYLKRTFPAQNLFSSETEILETSSGN